MKTVSLDFALDCQLAGYWGSDEQSRVAKTRCRVVRNGDVGKNGVIQIEDLPIRWFSEREIEKASVTLEDSILVSSGAYTGNVGRVSEDVGDGIPVVVSNFVRKLKAKESIRPDWLFQVLRSPAIQSQVPAFVGGSAIPNLGGDFYSGCRIPNPPSEPEQTRIAEVLSTVDRAIEQTERLITKQQRIKTGLMQDLLTRGINEHGNLRSKETHQFKDAPLGRIPVDWKHECLGNYIDVLSDYHSNGSYEKLRENVQLLSEPNYAVMIRTLNLENDNFEDLIYIDESAYRFLKKSRVEPGDVLMNKIANAGSVYLMPDLKRPVSCGMNLFLIRTHERLLLQTYAYYYLNFYEDYVKSFAKGTTTKTITKEAVRNLSINVPSVKEQERILTLIGKQDSIISSETRHRKKLHSLKTGLMQDLLSGKVPVTPLLTESEKTGA